MNTPENAPTLDALRSRREEILKITESRGARDVHVFGSVARRQSGPESDVDFHVVMQPGFTALDLGGLILDLQEALGRPVDVVEARPGSAISARILQEAVRL